MKFPPKAPKFVLQQKCVNPSLQQEFPRIPQYWGNSPSTEDIMGNSPLLRRSWSTGKFPINRKNSPLLRISSNTGEFLNFDILIKNSRIFIVIFPPKFSQSPKKSDKFHRVALVPLASFSMSDLPLPCYKLKLTPLNHSCLLLDQFPHTVLYDQVLHLLSVQSLQPNVNLFPL